MNKTAILIGLLSLSTAGCFAKGDREHPRQPPPEAIEACEGKAEGATVSFETPRGETVEGSCILKDDVLVAMPEHRPQR